MRAKIAMIAQNLRLPALCALCRQYHSNPKHLACCSDCLESFARLGPACQRCAQPLPNESSSLCPSCHQHPADLDHVLTAYRFEEPLRSLLHEFKYREGLYLSSLMAELMLQAWPAGHRSACLIPVPLHRSRLRQRGFNQAAELAKRLGKMLRIPCDLSSCQKIVNTPQQAGLNAQQRQRNLQQAFQSRELGYQHVTLIDDLMTTGETANEVARTLKNQGVERVELWCCARAC